MLFRWTDAQGSTVNWRGLGRAKNIRLDHYRSIRPVFATFTNMICKVAGKPPLSKESYCADVLDFFEAQETLGMEAIISGIHHVDWAYLLQKTWVPPAILPNKTVDPKTLATDL